MSSLPRSLQDAYSQIETLMKMISRHQNALDRSYQESQGTVMKVNDDRTFYEVQLPIEQITIKDAVLYYDKAYYQSIGFPNVGDFVKVYHKDAFSTAFVIARVNQQQGGIVMTKNTAIPLGSNSP